MIELKKMKPSDVDTKFGFSILDDPIREGIAGALLTMYQYRKGDNFEGDFTFDELYNWAMNDDSRSRKNSQWVKAPERREEVRIHFYWLVAEGYICYESDQGHEGEESRFSITKSLLEFFHAYTEE